MLKTQQMVLKALLMEKMIRSAFGESLLATFLYFAVLMGDVDALTPEEWCRGSSRWLLPTTGAVLNQR